MSDASLSRSTALGHLTYDDLLTAIDQLTPTSGDQVESWNDLRAICEELRASEEAAPITNNRHWLLREIEIEGYRGASSKVKLALDPHPGVTVIHGPNGAGKSTLSEALRSALWGDPGRSFIGETRKPGALWKPVELNKLSTDATVRVSLSDEIVPEMVLTLETTITAGASDLAITASGNLHDPETNSDISISNREALHAALISAPPVLAYADMANDLREIAHLKDWLTASLGMGPLLAGVEAVVDSRADTSTKLKGQLDAARKQAQSALESVDATAQESGYPLLEDRVIPIFENDQARDQWLADQNISDRAKAADLYERPTDDALQIVCGELLDAFGQLENASVSQGQLASALGALLEASGPATGDSGVENDECPACGSQEHDWREHTRLALESSAEYTSRLSAVTTIVQRSGTELLAPIGREVRIIRSASPNAAGINEFAATLELARAELAPGAMWNANALPNLRELAKIAVSDAGILLREEAIAKSNGLHDWQCRRWDAISGYLELWTSTHDAAAEAESWKATKARATVLTRHFRDERNTALSGGIDQNVSTLLEEFGLRVTALRITKNDADFGLTDLNNNAVALGELSAGQRNALILAPMLATAESSLFGFTLLDDPVHAFDEFRVDHLAEILAKIGRKQRLIVTTHDGRLVEQLRVHCGREFDLLEISRDAASATITFEPREDPATELIESAAQIIGLLKDQTDPAPAWSMVESLLRMSIDEALSACFHRSVISLPGAARKEKLAQFEALDTLDDRFAYLEQSDEIGVTDRGKLADARTTLAPHLQRWNGAIHNNQQTSPLSYDEVVVQKSAANSARKVIAKLGR